MSTDLTAAFDTVDSEILLKKLEYYGVKNMELKLFQSYLTDRKQFVEVDTFFSDIIKAPNCSVIQGGKCREFCIQFTLMNWLYYINLWGTQVNIQTQIMDH